MFVSSFHGATLFHRSWKMNIYPNYPRRPPNSAEDGSRAGIAPAGGGRVMGRAVLATPGAAGDRGPVGIKHLDPGLVTTGPNDGLNPRVRERTTRLHNLVSAETLSPSIR